MSKVYILMLIAEECKNFAPEDRILSVHKSKEGAEEAMKEYWQPCSDEGSEPYDNNYDIIVMDLME